MQGQIARLSTLFFLILFVYLRTTEALLPNFAFVTSVSASLGLQPVSGSILLTTPRHYQGRLMALYLMNQRSISIHVVDTTTNINTVCSYYLHSTMTVSGEYTCTL